MSTAETLAQARAAAELKDWKQAAKLLSGLPPADEILRERGWYASRAEAFDEAIACFAELQARRPGDHLPPYMIGFQYYQQQCWADALPHFEEALRLHPTHIKSLWRYAYALHKLGQEVRAALIAGKLLRVWNELPESKQREESHRYAQACHLIGRYQLAHDPRGAAELLRQALRFNSSDPYVYYQLSKALRKSGQPAEALENINSARSLKPGDVSIEVEYASILAMLGQRMQAVECIRRIQTRITGWSAYKTGLILTDIGETDLAVELLQRASRDRATRKDPKVRQALTQARAQQTLTGEACVDAADRSPEAAPGQARVPTSQRRRRRKKGKDDRSISPTPRSAGDAAAHDCADTGTIDLVRQNRGFGFLVDESGVRRHFRLPRGRAWRVGDRVSFTPADEPKGPAARNVRILERVSPTS